MARINDFGMPFTSVAGDRSYTSADWREYFRMLVESGVVGDIGNELQVKPQAAPNKTVFVETGAILINGVIRILESTTNLTFTDNTSGSTRVDRVVARLSVNDRKIELAVLQGTPGAGAPDLTRTATVHEMSLAQVALANGYSTIGAGQITDEREDVAACGFFRYRAKPAWYPEGGTPPRDAWMYTNFKEQLTPAEIAAIGANPTLMAIINSYFASKTEAEEGINSNKTMTPLRVKESVAYNEKKPITGMVTTSGSGTHNFTLPVNGSAVLVGTISPVGMASQPHKLVLQGQSNIEGGGGSTDVQIRYSLSGTTLTIINGSAYTGTRNYTYVIFY